MSSPEQPSVRILRLVFRIYCIVVLILLFARPQSGTESTYREQLAANLNLIPFRSITIYLYLLIRRPNDALFSYGCTNLFGNLLLFLPFGFLLPCLRQKMRSYWRLVVFSAWMILLLELLQLLTLLGSFDVDDLILNLLGVSVGYLAFRIAHRKWKIPS